MQTVTLKLKQASVVLGVPPKDLQNLVQLGVIRPARRNSVTSCLRPAVVWGTTARCSWTPCSSTTATACSLLAQSMPAVGAPSGRVEPIVLTLMVFLPC